MGEKEDVIKALLDAQKSGKLIKPKHDVNSLGTPYPGYRSVVDEAFIQDQLEAGNYAVYKYENTNPTQSDYLYQIKPIDPMVVPASGVPPESGYPTHPLDSWVAVSGMSQGWHLYGDDESNLKSKENLNYLGEL